MQHHIKQLCVFVLLMAFVGNTLPMSCLSMDLQELFSLMDSDHSCCESSVPKSSAPSEVSIPSVSDDGTDDYSQSESENFDLCDCSEIISSQLDQSIEFKYTLPQLNWVKDSYLSQIQSIQFERLEEGPPIQSVSFSHIQFKQTYLI